MKVESISQEQTIWLQVGDYMVKLEKVYVSGVSAWDHILLGLCGLGAMGVIAYIW